MPSSLLLVTSLAVVATLCAADVHPYWTQDEHAAAAAVNIDEQGAASSASSSSSSSSSSSLLARAHTVRVYVAQSNVDELHAHVRRASTPYTAAYGRWWSLDDMCRVMRPPANATRTVRSWLERTLRTAAAAAADAASTAAIDVRTVGGCDDVVEARAPVGVWQAALGVRFARYTAADAARLPAPLSRGRRRPRLRELVRAATVDAARATVGALSVSSLLPAHVARHVDVVTGVYDFPPRPRHTAMSVAAEAATTMIEKRDAEVRVAEEQAQHNAPKAPKAAQPTPLSALSVVPFRVSNENGTTTVAATYQVSCPDGKFARSWPPCNVDAGSSLQLVLVAQSYFDRTPISRAKTQPPVSPGVCVFNPAIAGGVMQCTARFVDATRAHDLLTIALKLISATDETAFGEYQYPVLIAPATTPDYLAAYYHNPARPDAAVYATQAVAEFEQQYYSPADLRTFFSEFGMPSSWADRVTTIGPNPVDKPGVEAELDIQWLMAVSGGLNTTFWSIAAQSTTEGLDDILKWGVDVLASPQPPMVHSVSYGMTEDNVDKFMGKGYLARSDIELAKMAARGLTVVIACGDTGAGDLGAPPMSFPTCDFLHADWPSQSTSVLSIGSTVLTPYSEKACWGRPWLGEPHVDCSANALGEVAVSMDQGLFWTTGGGFSNFTARPAWQAAAVDAYLSNPDVTFPPEYMWNRTGRAYPDASIVGHNLMVVVNGSFMSVDGTSASAPIFSGMLSLFNEARLAAGKSQLGFVNPLLYSLYDNGEAFVYNDVTYGNNRCGAVTTGCCSHGYDAGFGWDAVTGVGSLDFGQAFGWFVEA